MATFKLKDNRTESGVVPGVGRYVDGVLENAPDNFENPNFVKVTTAAPVTAAPPAPVALAVSAPPQPIPPPTPAVVEQNIQTPERTE